MKGFWFSHASRFLLHDREYVVREERDKDVVIEDIHYKEVKTVSVDYLLSEWDHGSLRPWVNEDESRKSIHDDVELYSDQELQEIGRRFSIIEPFTMGKKPPWGVAEYLAQLEPPKPSRATFYRWLKRYNSHNDKRYLCARYDARGPQGRRVDVKIMEVLIETLNDIGFYDGTDVSIFRVFTTLSKRVKDLNERRDGKDQIHMISRDTVYRIVHEIQDVYRKDVARHGRVAADLKKHGATTVVLSLRPLARVEVDWTQLGMFIVDTGTFQRERPYLIYAIDKCTSYPLGFHITFDEPNSIDIKQCLLHAMLPKTYVKEYYPEVKHTWDAWGVPEELVWDNAKVFESKDLEDLLELCEIDVQHCHVKSPHQKGAVEKGLQDINSIIQELPGSVFSNPQEKSNYDSSGKATVTLIGLYRILHVLLVDRIGHAVHHDHGKTRHQMWEEQLKISKVRRTLPYSKKALKLLFGSLLEVRSISNKGITIERQNFQSDALQELRQRVENKSGIKNPKVRVRYDLADMREIYVFDSDYERYITARVTTNSLEKKGIDENYPVHYQQLQDYSLSVSRGNRDFDVAELGEADETIVNVIKNDRALLRGVSRLGTSADKVGDDVPILSLVSLQLEQSALDAVPDLDTLVDVALVKPDSKTVAKRRSDKKEDSTPNLAPSAQDDILKPNTEHNNTTGRGTRATKRRNNAEMQLNDVKSIHDNSTHSPKMSDEAEQFDEDWAATYVPKQRGI